MHRILLSALVLTVACDSNDPTFMKVCETAQGFRYPTGLDTVSTACDDPAPIIWDAVPVRVLADEEASSYSDSLNSAIDLWNNAVDEQLFVRVFPPSLADATFVIGSFDGGAPAAMWHERDVDGRLIATIELRSPGDITEVYFFLAHELGHTVGLAHDPQRTSIMSVDIEAGLVNFDDGDEFEFPTLFVTDNDASALKNLYWP